MPLSTASFFTRDTNNTSKGYARSSDHAAYKIYQNITWSMWLALGPGTNKTIWSHWEDSDESARCWHFAVQEDGKFRILLSADGMNISLHYTADPIFDYSWINLAVTFGAGVLKIYVNGVEVAQTGASYLAAWGSALPLYSAGKRLMIASHNSMSLPIDTSPAGCISNFAMFDDVLDADELGEVYNNGQPADLSEHSRSDNLVIWYRMDQTDTPPTLIDSASGADATIVTSGQSGAFNPSANAIPLANLAADVKHGVTASDGTGTYRGADLWESVAASDLSEDAEYLQDGETVTGTAELQVVLTVRNRVDQILTAIESSGVTDDEWTALDLDSFTFDRTLYDALLALLEERESVSAVVERLRFYFLAFKVDLSVESEEDDADPTSEILVGAPLDDTVPTSDGRSNVFVGAILE